MREYTIKAQLLACRADNYTTYVFKDLDNPKYVMCTKLPNWDAPNIDIGEEGFLHYQEVIAGDKYYEPETGENVTYKYTNIYFSNFVKITKINNKEIIL